MFLEWCSLKLMVKSRILFFSGDVYLFFPLYLKDMEIANEKFCLNNKDNNK